MIPWVPLYEWFSSTMTMRCGAFEAEFTANAVDEVAVTPATVTEIAPVVAPLGTVVLICESDVTVNAAVLLLKKVTAVAPVNPVPLITTDVPTGPFVGPKLVIVGPGGVVTVKVEGLRLAVVAVPPGGITVI